MRFRCRRVVVVVQLLNFFLVVRPFPLFYFISVVLLYFIFMLLLFLFCFGFFVVVFCFGFFDFFDFLIFGFVFVFVQQLSLIQVCWFSLFNSHSFVVFCARCFVASPSLLFILVSFC